MKSLLEKELRLLAQEILDIKTDEDLSLCHEKARLLYEKLTVLVYTGHHLGQEDADENDEIDIISPVVESIEEEVIVSVDETALAIEEVTHPVIEEVTAVETPVIEDSPATEDIKEENVISFDQISLKMLKCYKQL